MTPESDYDFRIHGRVDSRTHDGERVHVEVETTAVVPLENRLEFVTSESFRKPRTLEVRCEDWVTLSPESNRKPGAYAGDIGVDIVGNYRGTTKAVNRDKSFGLGFLHGFHPAHIPVGKGHVVTLPVKRSDSESRVVVSDATLQITACYYDPLYDPFFPPILGSAAICFAERNTDDFEIAVVSTEPVDPATKAHTTGQILTEDKRISITVDTRERLSELDAACCRLLEKDETTITVGFDTDLQLEVIRDGVPYVSADVVRITRRTTDGDEHCWHVRLVTFTIAVANAVVNADCGYEAGGIVLALLRRGLASIENGKFKLPGDPYEKYSGVIQGFSLAKTGNPLSDDRWQVSTDEAEAWALLDRNYDGNGLIEAYHSYRRE